MMTEWTGFFDAIFRPNRKKSIKIEKESPIDLPITKFNETNENKKEESVEYVEDAR